MATLVGSQMKFETAMNQLLELEYDACGAYQAAIKRMKSKEYKAKFESFCQDHQRHIKELTALMEKHECKMASGPDRSKSYLAKGKVMVGKMMGDAGILMAMKTNEDDTNTAYERCLSHPNKWADCESYLQDALSDERRHREWIMKTMSTKTRSFTKELGL